MEPKTNVTHNLTYLNHARFSYKSAAAHPSRRGLARRAVAPRRGRPRRKPPDPASTKHPALPVLSEAEGAALNIGADLSGLNVSLS